MSRGLVLEGGGLRGIFTAGVLDYFMDAGLEFDTVIGVSAGACHACSYISRQRGRALRISTDYLSDSRYCSVKSLVTTGDMFGVDFCYRQIPDMLDRIDNKAFAANPSRFYATVTELETGKAVYHHVKDTLHETVWVQASASLPLVSRKVLIDGKYYLDGGIADSIPFLKSRHLGNEKNVVVLTQAAGFRKQPNPLQPAVAVEYHRYPNFVRASAERHIVYNRTLDLLAEEEARGGVFLIRPPFDLNIGRVEKDLDKLFAGYQAGYDEAKRLYPALTEYLELPEPPVRA